MKGCCESKKAITDVRALKPKHVAERYGIPVQSLANDRHNCRGIPFVKYSKSIYYMVDDVEAYLRSKRVDPN